MGIEIARGDRTDHFRQENEVFRWFQGYGTAAPALGALALERVGDRSLEVTRGEIAELPSGQGLLARLYFSGFSTEVIGEICGDDIQMDMAVDVREAPAIIEESIVVSDGPEEVVLEVTEGEASVVVEADASDVIVAVEPEQPRQRKPRQARAANGKRRSGKKDDIATLLQVNRDALNEQGEWVERALCAQTDPEAFFPEKGGSTREAKKVCASCDVRGECLDYALAHDERFGIWGGLSERERRKLKRRQAA